MSTEVLAGLAGILLSLAFSYIPALKKWLDGKDSTTKSLVMLFSMASVAISSLAAGCVGIFDSFSVSCDVSGVETVTRAFLGALVANQAAYQLTEKI